MHERYTLPLGQFATPRFIFHEPVYAVSQDPNEFANGGTPESPPWWQSILSPVITTGLTIGTAVAQRELFGQTPGFVQTPSGPVALAGTTPGKQPAWLWPAVIGGGLLLWFTLNKRRRR